MNELEDALAFVRDIRNVERRLNGVPSGEYLYALMELQCSLECYQNLGTNEDEIGWYYHLWRKAEAESDPAPSADPIDLAA